MKKLALFTVAMLAFAPGLVGAAPVNPPGPNPNFSSLDGLLGLLNEIASWMLAFLLALAVVMVLYAAFLYLTAAGDEAKIKKAGSVLMYAAIAVAVGALAWTLPRLAESIIRI